MNSQPTEKDYVFFCFFTLTKSELWSCAGKRCYINWKLTLQSGTVCAWFPAAAHSRMWFFLVNLLSVPHYDGQEFCFHPQAGHDSFWLSSEGICSFWWKPGHSWWFGGRLSRVFWCLGIREENRLKLLTLKSKTWSW